MILISSIQITIRFDYPIHISIYWFSTNALSGNLEVIFRVFLDPLGIAASRVLSLKGTCTLRHVITLQSTSTFHLLSYKSRVLGGEPIAIIRDTISDSEPLIFFSKIPNSSVALCPIWNYNPRSLQSHLRPAH